MVLPALDFNVSEPVDLLARLYQAHRNSCWWIATVLRTDLHSPERTGSCVAGDRAPRRQVRTWSMPGPLNKWLLGKATAERSLDGELSGHVSNPWSLPPL